ncbi:uncharacterized protein LOC132261974 [Phlebotomus argentipes]|uniref:uncharacterized protein LOC132261974 n=1 Tax=Phlebotomus argentipes TaxID=94469 RepID=UPI002892FDD1|nr:uncharacterized protein LOC132261974 [Phlebotomus argentipes]
MTSTVDSARHSLPEDKLARPVSAYDNLNGKSEARRSARASLGEERNGGFPYTEISFKFGDIPARRSDDVMSDATSAERQATEAADKMSENLGESVQSDELRRQNCKASISSAKSSFFGLNGDAQSSGGVPRRRIRLRMDEDEEDSEEYGEETVKLLPEVVNTFNSTASTSNSYQNVPRNSHKFQKQLSYVQEMKLVDSSSSSESPGQADVVPRLKSPAKSVSESESNRLSQPSQSVYMATTVPQNMKPAQITGRHVPTRSSLRHSRMLVVNKSFKENGTPNPLNLRHPKWGKFFLIMQILSGILALAIGLWLLLWAPSTRAQDNPYWSGILLIIAGSIGCSLMDFKRAPRSKSREMCFRALKIKFSVCVILATLASLLASLFAAVHLGALSATSTNCLPSNIFTISSTCVCLFGRRNETTDHLEILRHTNGDAHEDPDAPVADTGGTEFHYRDLNCREVVGPFRYILMGSIVTNLVGFIAAASVLILYWTGRRQRRRFEAAGPLPGVTQLP